MRIETTTPEKALRSESLEISEGVYLRPDGTIIITGPDEAVIISRQGD